MDEPEVEAVLALLDPLLLVFVSRHIHRPDFADLMSSMGAPNKDMRSAWASQ